LLVFFLMTGRRLRQLRKQSKRSQATAARELGVTQAYLSMLENGERPITEDLLSRAVRVFQLPATELSLADDLAMSRSTTNERLAADFAVLGYPGFSHLKRSAPRNPVEVLFLALKSNDLEARVVEALPWVVLNYPQMNWKALVAAAKMNDLQNRLGYVVTLARRLAEQKGQQSLASKLKQQELQLERSLLFREETLCNESMTNAERKWLAKNRPEEARRWRLLTYFAPDHIRYAS